MDSNIIQLKLCCLACRQRHRPWLCVQPQRIAVWLFCIACGWPRSCPTLFYVWVPAHIQGKWLDDI